MNADPTPLWRRLALKLYYATTYPGRQWYLGREAASGRAPLAILVFHRVADDGANDWTTPTGEFVDAIHWLEDHVELVSLEEVQRRIRERHNDRLAVSITFDDGYADNCRVALPVLVEERIPCTYFVSTGPVLESTFFPHDLEMGNRLPPNSVEKLAELSRQGIEIGAHTRTHADLGRITDRDMLVDELITAREDLEAAVGQPIRYFAFPFGRQENLSDEAFCIGRAAGYAAMCSAYGGYNLPGDDAFHLQRRGVDGPAIRIKNRVMADPRELRVRRFHPVPSPPADAIVPVAASVPSGSCL